MAKNQIFKILTAPDKGVTKTSGPNGVLSRLWRQILHDLSVSPSRYGQLMFDFINDTRNGVPNNKKDQTSMRGNLTKEFGRSQMTWKVFCKSLRFLQILKFRIHLTAYHANGKVTEHVTVVDFGTRADVNQLMTELDKAEQEEPDSNENEQDEE